MLTQYAINKIRDAVLRGEALPAVTSWYVGIFSTLPTDRASTGTEISTGAGFTGYARVAYDNTMVAISGTQGAGTTSASSGTDDHGSNNAALTFSAALAAAWAGLVGVGLYDASSGGNLWVSGPITNAAGTAITRSFAIGDAVELEADTLEDHWA
jgi:hypothetical protein